jgi:uncharacterized protein YhfF
MTSPATPAQDPVDLYWERFLATLPAEDPRRFRDYIADAFGDNPALADELARLIANGVKRATCSALWAWQAEGEEPPKRGQLCVVLDGKGAPVCIIETTSVAVIPFNEVDAAFAHAEGEGDRSLEQWRAGHERFFTRTLAARNRSFAPTMPLVCERFKVIYR